ncbi:AfsR/SARP family transcriptional regulator [Streptomyces ureilyticus]|uniref:OmpR/PhoB-type domain-containing protein n=1 Tax=Streptomyces ureilyticus TaxID=1775131 RepID=A0ABX0E4A7_9ACTN|nr:AfsR/SARP family transcriptional regulator [Streptomyces ureilyticus]NGO47254.1 hypothetical protein [Streptomyces ureilyticus]
MDGSRQERALAALLLSANRTVTIEHLIDVVWEEPPATARRQIQDIVPRLRRKLLSNGAPSDIISTRRPGYLLRLEGNALDAHAFDELATAGHELIPVDIAAAATKLREALLLWRGEMLTGIGSSRLESAARIWQDRHLTVWEECLALELALGHHDVTTELRTLVDRFPLREPLVGLLMLALHAAGQRVEALAAFRALQKRLAGELGLDPGGDLQQVHTAILRSGPHAEFMADPIAQLRRFRFTGQLEQGTRPSAVADGPLVETHGPTSRPCGGPAHPTSGAAPVEPTVGSPQPSEPAPSSTAGPGPSARAGHRQEAAVEHRHRSAATPDHLSGRTGLPIPAQLPLAARDFSGRASELARLDTLARDGAASTAMPVLAITGTAGVGKTALAVHWASQVAHRFPDGQLYVDLRGFAPDQEVTSPADAVRGFLDALQVPAHSVPAGLAAQVNLFRSLLAGRRMLILLDNAKDSEQVRPLLPGASECLVVITSRNRLTSLVAAEGARPIALGMLTAQESRQLLADRLGPDRLAVEPRATNEIINSCAGLPLALAVVAALDTTRTTPRLQSLAEQLRDDNARLGTLTTGDPVTDVKTVLSWSYDRLSPEAARLLRLLGLHPGPDITEPAAASLAGVPAPLVRGLLTELTQANLTEEHSPGRYSLPGLMRSYASELAHTLDDDTQRQAAVHRMLDHYLRTGQAAACLLSPHRTSTAPSRARAGVVFEELDSRLSALAWFTSERQVLLGAVSLAADAGFSTHAWRLAVELADHLYERDDARHDRTPSQDDVLNVTVSVKNLACHGAPQHAARPPGHDSLRQNNGHRHEELSLSGPGGVRQGGLPRFGATGL